MARAANSRFYDPADPNSIVALETRCDIMYTVFKHEPGSWPKSIEILEPLSAELPFCTEAWCFDMLAQSISNLVFWSDYHDSCVDHNKTRRWLMSEANRWGKSYSPFLYPEHKLEQQGRLVEGCFSLAQSFLHHLPDDNADEAISTLCRAYRDSRLKNMGARPFSLLLRFVSFCFVYGMNPREFKYIYQMIVARAPTVDISFRRARAA